jgi:hypothetical protein
VRELLLRAESGVLQHCGDPKVAAPEVLHAFLPRFSVLRQVGTSVSILPNALLSDSFFWANLGRIDLGEKSIQVLANTRSALRQLVLMDEKGKVMRTKPIEALWAVVESDSRTPRLLGISQTAGTRLLIYHWRWLY